MRKFLIDFQVFNGIFNQNSTYFFIETFALYPHDRRSCGIKNELRPIVSSLSVDFGKNVIRDTQCYCRHSHFFRYCESILQRRNTPCQYDMYLLLHYASVRTLPPPVLDLTDQARCRLGTTTFDGIALAVVWTTQSCNGRRRI
jgi:hypothetical protein